MEKAGYFFLGIVVVIWIAGILFGFIVSLPVGLIGLPLILGIGLLLIKVIKDRLSNEEDDYYSKNVNQ